MRVRMDGKVQISTYRRGRGSDLELHAADRKVLAEQVAGLLGDFAKVTDGGHAACWF